MNFKKKPKDTKLQSNFFSFVERYEFKMKRKGKFKK